LIQTGGTMYINGGQLEVEGDYRIENNGSSVLAYLKMVNEADYVKVGGSFSTYSWHNHTEYLTAGTMEVKGDFIQKGYSGSSNSPYNFKASGTHKVILSGSEKQAVSFERPRYSHFNILGITKPLEEGYTFTNTEPVWNSIEEVTEDREPPTKPANLHVDSKTYSTITISWDVSTDNTKVDRYIIYRDGHEVGSTSMPPYTDTGLLADTTYEYSLIACDIYGNMSEESDVIIVTTESDSMPPSVPVGLAVQSRTDVSITISWEASTDDVGVAEYDVFRDGKYIGSTRDTVYHDTGLTPDKEYRYSVRAKDAAGNVSRTSSYIVVRTLLDAVLPDSPRNLRVVSKTATSVSLAWDAATDNIGVTGYIVVREANGEKTPLGSVKATEYTDTNLEPETTYLYYVIARDKAGNNSEASNTVEVATEKDTEKPTTPTG
jgi:chitodextrinase